MHSYKGRIWDHKVAAGRCCSEYGCWCPWVWYASKEVQVLSDPEICLRSNPWWPADPFSVCLNCDYSIIISICYQYLVLFFFFAGLMIHLTLCSAFLGGVMAVLSSPSYLHCQVAGTRILLNLEIVLSNSERFFSP